jgi:hypothetical protein
MKRVVVIAACGLSLAACSSLPSWMQFDLPKPAPATTTMQFESEPAGADAQTSLGQSCRTPCALDVAANEFSVTFSLPGYQPQTVPVRVVGSPDNTSDPNSTPQGEGGAAPRLVPNPVFVQLQPIAPPKPPPKRRPAAKKKPAPKPAPRPAPTSMAPAPAPAPAPASPWPPPPTR